MTINNFKKYISYWLSETIINLAEELKRVKVRHFLFKMLLMVNIEIKSVHKINLQFPLSGGMNVKIVRNLKK